MERITYQVTVKNSNRGSISKHEVIVNLCGDGTRFCSAAEFGCSRNYAVDANHKAVQMFLAEHACRITRFVLPNGRELRCAVNA